MTIKYRAANGCTVFSYLIRDIFRNILQTAMKDRT